MKICKISCTDFQRKKYIKKGKWLQNIFISIGMSADLYVCMYICIHTYMKSRFWKIEIHTIFLKRHDKHFNCNLHCCTMMFT